MNDYETKCNQETTGLGPAVSYKEPTILEQLESERDNTIEHLSTIVKKISMLRFDSTLEDKIKFFKRY